MARNASLHSVDLIVSTSHPLQIQSILYACEFFYKEASYSSVMTVFVSEYTYVMCGHDGLPAGAVIAVRAGRSP